MTRDSPQVSAQNLIVCPGGRRPLDVLADGDYEAVRQAAASFADGAYVLHWLSGPDSSKTVEGKIEG